MSSKGLFFFLGLAEEEQARLEEIERKAAALEAER